MADTSCAYESLADIVSMSSFEPPADGNMTFTVLMCNAQTTAHVLISDPASSSVSCWIGGQTRPCRLPVYSCSGLRFAYCDQQMHDQNPVVAQKNVLVLPVAHYFILHTVFCVLSHQHAVAALARVDTCRKDAHHVSLVKLSFA